MAARGQRRDDRAAAVACVDARRTCHGRCAHVPGTSRRNTPVSRLLRVRRRHGTRRLCRQRDSRGLRLAVGAGDRRARQDRARALLGTLQLPRLQSAHRAATRRRWPPHLLGSGRRRGSEGEGVSRRTVGPGHSYSAGRNRLRLHGSGRPADAGLGVAAGRAESRSPRRRLAAGDRERATLLQRRAGDSRIARRTRSPACSGAAPERSPIAPDRARRLSACV